MKTKINVSTKDLILSLINDKMNLINLNNEKDKTIYSLQRKLNKYERNIKNAR